ncbi:hypothetical protein AAVH_07636 [Aphelenchoides avenae]|nr:hypothetical protein AAVH_07636 [Aphelenchus avenae]
MLFKLLVAAAFCHYVVGAQRSFDCIENCLEQVDDDGEWSYHARLFKRALKSDHDFCDWKKGAAIKFWQCTQKCPSSDLDVVVRQFDELVVKYCAARRPVANKFWDDHDALMNQLLIESSSCSKRGYPIGEEAEASGQEDEGSGEEDETTEELCKSIKRCDLGFAVEKVKISYTKDVITSVVDVYKIHYAILLQKGSPGALPHSCDFLFQPYD